MTNSGQGSIAGTRGGDVLAGLKSGRIQGPEARLRAAAALLEGTFYEELFKAMRDTVPEGGVVVSGGGQEMFESLLDQSIAESAALSTDRGLGRALYRKFSDGVAAAQPTSPDALAGLDKK